MIFRFQVTIVSSVGLQIPTGRIWDWLMDNRTPLYNLRGCIFDFVTKLRLLVVCFIEIFVMKNDHSIPILVHILGPLR